MKYSIIIPVYHSHKGIARCLDSFLNQSISESFEILCIGDKIEDPTHSIVLEYAKKHPATVQLHLQDGRGIGGARNLGLDLAKGEYIMFSDADDYVSTDILEKCINALNEYDADIVCTGFERISESGKKYSSEMRGKTITTFDLTPKNVPRLAFIYPAPWGKLFKRELIGDSRFPDEPISASAYEDLLFNLAIYPKVKKYVHLPGELYHYIVYPESNISTVSKEKTQAFRSNLAAVRQEYIAAKLLDQYLIMLDLVAMIHAGIANVHRTAEDPSVNLRAFCKEAKMYLNENFPNWRRIKLRPYGQLTLRCGFVWMAKIMYRCNMLWFFIRVYNWMIRTFRVDVKW